MCSFLITYCQNLRPETKNQDNQNGNVKAELKIGKEWEKEIKKGAEVITSKKDKTDQEPVKKPKKEKKKDVKV